jgi:hypothetical protein
MADKETVERWTVPQASVWIRTRDLAIVRELGPYTACSLTMAALAMPDVLTASGCLVAALRMGRVAASGRLVQEMSDATYRILGDDRETIPQSFWQGDGEQAGGRLSDDPDRGVTAAEPGDAARWIDLDVEAGACIRRWQPPAAILADGALSIGQLAARLGPEPIDRLRWLLTHPAVIVTGLNDRAERVTVDAAALALGVADIETDALTTRDGRLCWSQVTIDLAPAAGAVSASAPPRRGVGNVPFDDVSLVARALAAIASGEQKSPLAAALALAKEIKGNSTPDSKVRRLAGKIRLARLK